MCDQLNSETPARWYRLLNGSALPQDPGSLVDLLRDLEDLKSYASAMQARAAAELDAVRRDEEASLGVPSQQRGKGVASEVALARRESTHRGQRFLGMAKILVSEMPETLELLASGKLNEWRATLAVRETACLSVQDRAAVDAELSHQLNTDEVMGDRKLVGWIRRKAYALDAASVVRRAARAESERRVTLRPAPDTMTWLSALLSVKQGVAVFAALSRAADSARAVGDERSRGQVMADVLTERVTGAPAKAPAAIELVVEITDRALFSVTDEPAHVQGYGWVPAGWVRRLILDAEEHQVEIRRLFRSPGRMIQVESDKRHMTAGIRRVIGLRDRVCRTPWCDAPIRHADHVVAATAGGESSTRNGQGLCEACNYTKQAPGWQANAGYDSEGNHIVEVTTPTGHSYRSQAPPPVADDGLDRGA